MLALKGRGVAVLLNSPDRRGRAGLRRAVILEAGRVAASGTLAELLGRRELRLRLTDLPPAETQLAATGHVERAGDRFTVVLPADDVGTGVPDLVRDSVSLGARMHAVVPARISLDERLLASCGRATAATRYVGPHGGDHRRAHPCARRPAGACCSPSRC